jgi:membrane protease YdiL (CAAX protease family)
MKAVYSTMLVTAVLAITAKPMAKLRRANENRWFIGTVSVNPVIFAQAMLPLSFFAWQYNKGLYSVSRRLRLAISTVHIPLLLFAGYNLMKSPKTWTPYIVLCILEEYATRHILLNSLLSIDPKSKTWVTALCWALLFSSGHFYHLERSLTVGTFFLGFFLCLLYLRTGDFVAAVLTHFNTGVVYFENYL